MQTDHERTEKSAAPNINVTPLIDILLVLLIIFMVITPLKPTRFKTLVPEKSEDPREKISPHTLIVSVEENLQLKLIRGETIIAEASIRDPAVIATTLAREWRERQTGGIWRLGMENRFELAPDERIERTVFIRAPRSIGYGEVAKVIDGIKGAGAQPIGLQTDELPN
ncbi:MAG: biopolymer transporter ExbD [Pyrinomonadaceae bacterium]